MDYWDEEMKDDIYMIIENGWQAKPYIIKDSKERDKGWTCDILPKEIVIDEYFKTEKQEIEDLEAQKEEIVRQMEELKEEHSGEDGVFEEVKNEKGNITKGDLKRKLKEYQGKSEFEEELKVLQKYLNLIEEESKIKKKIKEKEKKLDKKLLEKYAQLTEEEIKDLVVNKKWMKHLKETLNDELDNIVQNLISRIKELAERYETPLPEIEREIQEYEQRVKEHLKVMGFNF